LARWSRLSCRSSSGVMAIAIALTAVGIIANFTPMSVFVLNMITMIGLGVGIDYSLLVVTRFREELNAGLRSHEAALRTFLTAGHAVMTSGATVVVGFSRAAAHPAHRDAQCRHRRPGGGLRRGPPLDDPAARPACRPRPTD
jgi:hypothetical protein